MKASAQEVFPENLRTETAAAGLFRGLARSYGDACLPAEGQRRIVATTHANRILSFDEDSGSLRGEAGLSLREINRLFLPRRYFSPVTPGTQFVTLGGMVAADVHGKNHHQDGCFGRHVTAITLRLADGRVVRCGPNEERELFDATVGGMGLTGQILEVEFPLKRIPTPWIWCESSRVKNIDEYIAALKEAGPRWPYTVGWLDCLSRGKKLGRGILQRGRWAELWEAPVGIPEPKKRVTVPFTVPGFVLGRLSVHAFNTVYYHAHWQRHRRGILHPEPFFYPLDKILAWNRLYGPRGFTQYQCVLPEEAGQGAARRFLERLTARGGASFLCVIKDCGDEGAGLLSFPLRGISIALDIAIRDDTEDLVAHLNELVIAMGGRVYLAKDSFTSAQHFAAMEPRLSRFLEARDRFDPRHAFKSAQSVRLFGDTP